jgi:hypothetical protein
VRLVWSQPATPHDREPRLLSTALICIFLGGAVANAGGRDARPPSRVFRAAAASLLATGGALFLVGGASLVYQKQKRRQRARKTASSLTLAVAVEAGDEREPSLRKEDQP